MDIILKYFPQLTSVQIEQYQQIIHLYKAWNTKINVISRKDIDEIVQAVGLKNVKAEQKRAETITQKFDFVISRAVTQMPEFVKWVDDKIKKKSLHQMKNGILYLKGGDLTQELIAFKEAEVFDLSDYFTEDFFETKKVVYLPI